MWPSLDRKSSASLCTEREKERKVVGGKDDCFNNVLKSIDKDSSNREKGRESVCVVFV